MNHPAKWQSVICKVLSPYFSRAGLLTFFVLFNLPLVYPQDAAKPVISYNRLTDETAVGISIALNPRLNKTSPTEMQESLTLAAGFRYKGRQRTVLPATVRLALQSQARSRHFTEGQNLIAVIDGIRVGFGTLSYALKDLGTTQVETLRVDVPAHTFLKLARAHSVELHVGGRDVTLGTMERSALAALAEQLERSAITTTEPHADIPGKAIAPQAAQPAHTPLPAAHLGNTPIAPSSTHSCPIQVQQLLPLRGFNLGQSFPEVMHRFKSNPPVVPKPDVLGIRTLRLPIYSDPAERGTTRLTAVELRFLDERLYRIEATYLIGKEWTGQQMAEFANGISRQLGVASTWTIGTNNSFDLNCGAAQLTLSVDEDSFIDMPTERRESIAAAYFTLTDIAAAAQLKQRRIDAQQRSRQRDAQQRRIFKP